jgi:hypothetical protein
MRRALVLIAACGALAASSRGASAPESFLLRIRTQVYAASVCDRSTTETLIFRDGLVVESLRSERGVLHLARFRAPSAAVAELNAALSRGRIGHESGDCQLEVPAAPGRFYEFGVDWFGEAGRRNSFVLTSAAGGSPCREETAALFDAIENLVASARAAAGAQTAQLPFPRSAFCEGVSPAPASAD